MQLTVTMPTAQFSYLQVVGPQVGSRLHALDPATENSTYVNAVDWGAVRTASELDAT